MSTLWVVGDSTLSAFEDKYYYPRYGYGTMLANYLDDSIEVKNIALSGRSSKSFMEEPEYGELLAGMKKGDFLLIGFGHNDEKTEEGRHTAGRGTYEDKGSFAESLYTNYYLKAKEAGCTTILCTPIVRRPSGAEWMKENLHVTADQGRFIGGDYSEAIRSMGDMLNIPVVDMTSVTKKLYEQMGFENAKYLHAWPSDKESSVDNTHTNIWGGRVNAYLCMQQVKHLGINGMSEHVILDEQVEFIDREVRLTIAAEGKLVAEGKLSNEDNDGTSPATEGRLADNDDISHDVRIPSRKYLISDPSYHPVEFNPNLVDSKLWKPYGDWKGTVFGDIPPGGDFSKFTLEPIDGGVHIAVRDNAGKIAGVTDGIAMYYRKVPVDADFTLSAKMTVNSYFKNNQVAFGLMVRDDCYIDTQMPDALGDYVAASPFMLTRDEGIVKCFARKSGAIFNGGTISSTLIESLSSTSSEALSSTSSGGVPIGVPIDVKITSSTDGYALYFGDDEALTGGFDFKLTSIDPDNVYVGMFVARNADVTFTDIRLEII